MYLFGKVFYAEKTVSSVATYALFMVYKSIWPFAGEKPFFAVSGRVFAPFRAFLLFGPMFRE